ncbi:trichohyalin-like [Macrobrachium rosenbergii]|uniref:trichohyalin-like n=1 Tax=Macrobrachium rosenbergii TaxID=79674 RepID=UPI0034D45F06
MTNSPGNQQEFLKTEGAPVDPKMAQESRHINYCVRGSDSRVREDEVENSDCEDDHSYSEEDHSSDTEEDDGSDSEDHSSDREDDYSSESEEIVPLHASRKVENLIKENENVSRLEKESLQKDLMITELKKMVEGLTEGRLKTEQNIRDLECLSQEKDRQIYSLSEETRKLRNEIMEKAKDTEMQIKEKEEKDQTLIILENTVVVLEMEKETLHRNLQQREDSKTEMQVEISKLNKELKTIREENVRKQNRIESLQKENQHKTLMISGLEDKLQVLTTERQEAHANLEQLDRCEKEIAGKKEELEKLREQNLQRDKEILRLEDECSQKQKEIIVLLKESKTVVAEKSKANGKVNEMARRIVQLEFELAEAKEELETMEFEKMEATLELERLQERPWPRTRRSDPWKRKLKFLKEKRKCLQREKNMIKMVPQERPTTERKAEKEKALNTTRCLRKPKINCKVLYQQMDNIEEGLRQIMALQRPSTGTKTHSKDPAKTPSDKKPLSRKEVHQKMRLESAARLRTLEQESEKVRKLYKINAVT